MALSQEVINYINQQSRTGMSPSAVAFLVRKQFGMSLTPQDISKAASPETTATLQQQAAKANEQQAFSQKLQSYLNTLNPIEQQLFREVNLGKLGADNAENIRYLTQGERDKLRQTYQDFKGVSYSPEQWASLGKSGRETTDKAFLGEATRAVGPVANQLRQTIVQNQNEFPMAQQPTVGSPTTALPGVTNIPGSGTNPGTTTAGTTQTIPPPPDIYEQELIRSIRNADATTDISALRKELALYQQQQAERAKAEAEFKKYQEEQVNLNKEAQKRLDIDRQVEQAAASIGGASPSELARLRAAFETPTAGITPESISQAILGERQAGINKQTEGFQTLRDALKGKFDTSRANLQTAQDQALTKYGEVASNVQSKVLERLLPQIQSQLAARGLETGGGAFQAQTAKLATDLATETEGQVASRRLDLDTSRADLGRGDEQFLANLEIQHNDILRQQIHFFV